ncbi:hypothetical protein HOH45_06115 [bacterium]|jgi:hypothetical protein|nr:hypothetical protein [bacterium]
MNGASLFKEPSIQTCTRSYALQSSSSPAVQPISPDLPPRRLPTLQLSSSPEVPATNASTGVLGPHVYPGSSSSPSSIFQVSKHSAFHPYKKDTPDGLTSDIGKEPQPSAPSSEEQEIITLNPHKRKSELNGPNQQVQNKSPKTYD